MNFMFPNVCLNPFLTKVLDFAPLALIFLESPWKVVSDVLLACTAKVWEPFIYIKKKGLDRTFDES